MPYLTRTAQAPLEPPQPAAAKWHPDGPAEPGAAARFILPPLDILLHVLQRKFSPTGVVTTVDYSISFLKYFLTFSPFFDDNLCF
jgi:hypothetical protein